MLHMRSRDGNLMDRSKLESLARPVQVIAVTGGKGGVGKTSVAVNLAAALTAANKRVVLLDGDLGLANVDVFLGLSPRFTLAHVLSGERTLDEILVTAPQGFQVVPAASGAANLANMDVQAHLGLVQAFSALATQVDVADCRYCGRTGPRCDAVSHRPRSRWWLLSAMNLPP